MTLLSRRTLALGLAGLPVSALAAKPVIAPLSAADQALVDKAGTYLQGLTEAKGGFVQTDARGAVTQGTLFIRRHVFETVRFAEDRPCWHDYDFIRRVQGQFTMKRFHQRTYRYYRNTSASVVDRMKADWPLAPVSTTR